MKQSKKLAIFIGILALVASVLGMPASNAVVIKSAAPIKCAKATYTINTPTGLTLPTKLAAAKSYTMTMVTNCGTIKITLDGKKAPLTTTVFKYLAGKKYFDQTICHRITTSGIYILQCGDPEGNGSGGPGFAYKDENLPTTVAKDRYPVGTVAMANAGPGTNGSQFFLVYKTGTFDLPASYSIIGKVTSGLGVLQGIGANGVLGGGQDGSPAVQVVVNKITISN